MFTGLIEAVGTVVASEPLPAGRRLRVDTPLVESLRPGDSVATSGVCLTVAERTAAAVDFDVSPETLAVTTLGVLRPGDRVNLARPLRADGHLGGHFVQGHVDGVGDVVGLGQEEEFWRITIAFPVALAPLLIPRGSVAIDGISLTVAALGEDRFEVQIIPHTWRHTNLSERRVGDVVNLECDMLGKYVWRAIQIGAVRTVAQPAGERTP